MKNHCQELIGKVGVDYNQRKGIIVAAEYAKDWEKLEEYDGSGWMHESTFDEMNIEETDILVAFKEDEDGRIEVYTYGNGGVDLV